MLMIYHLTVTCGTLLSMSQALKDQLSRVSNADEAEKLILDHSKNLNAVTDKLETQKHQQLHKLQDQLINRFVQIKVSYWRCKVLAAIFN